MENFNISLKHFRKLKKLTQQQLSEKLYMKRSTYASYETGRNEPSLTTIKAISKILGITVDEILNWEDGGNDRGININQAFSTLTEMKNHHKSCFDGIERMKLNEN